MYSLDAAPVIVRVARSLRMLPAVAKEMRVAQWLERENYPAVRLAADTPREPLLVDDHPVTFWARVNGPKRKVRLGELGRLLGRFHELPMSRNLDLPTFDPFVRGPARLAHIPDTVDRSDVEFLIGEYKRLRDEFACLAFALPSGPIHGDAHTGNCLLDDRGEVLLLDFEEVAYGPREWDLTITAMNRKLGWGNEASYSDFVAAYGGFDVENWSGYTVLRSIKELNMTSWLLQLSADAPAADEFASRVSDIRSGAYPRSWRPF